MKSYVNIEIGMREDDCIYQLTVLSVDYTLKIIYMKYDIERFIWIR